MTYITASSAQILAVHEDASGWNADCAPCNLPLAVGLMHHQEAVDIALAHLHDAHPMFDIRLVQKPLPESLRSLAKAARKARWACELTSVHRDGARLWSVTMHSCANPFLGDAHVRMQFQEDGTGALARQYCLSFNNLGDSSGIDDLTSFLDSYPGA